MMGNMQKYNKIKYEVDPHNRLIITKSGKKLKTPGFRHVLEGRFKVSKKNTVSYHLKHPQSSPIPQQLKLSGSWSVDKKHNLVLTLDKKHNQIVKDRLTLKTEIINARAEGLEFLIASKDRRGRAYLYILALRGRWQADRYNRLQFLATRRKDLDDRIILKGSWEVNQKNQIIYSYARTVLKTKKKTAHTVAFKGHWDIPTKNRIIYVLNKQTNSGFDFKVGLGKPAKKGLQYEIGVGLVPKKKKITLFGRWKVNPRLGLIFEMRGEKGKLRRIVFTAKLKLKKNSYLEARLKNSSGGNLGISLKLSKSILKGTGQAYLRALKDGKEITLLSGAGFRW